MQAPRANFECAPAHSQGLKWIAYVHKPRSLVTAIVIAAASACSASPSSDSVPATPTSPIVATTTPVADNQPVVNKLRRHLDGGSCHVAIVIEDEPDRSKAEQVKSATLRSTAKCPEPKIDIVTDSMGDLRGESIVPQGWPATGAVIVHYN